MVAYRFEDSRVATALRVIWRTTPGSCRSMATRPVQGLPKPASAQAMKRSYRRDGVRTCVHGSMSSSPRLCRSTEAPTYTCRPLRRKTFRHGQRGTLVSLKGNLLRQHDIARDEIGVGYKAPTNAWAAGAVDLMDVHGGAMSDPVSSAAVAASDVEISFSLKLLELLGRKPSLRS
jgi:hypothetical protein